MKKNIIIIILIIIAVAAGYVMAKQDASLREQREAADATKSYIATLEDTVTRLKARETQLAIQYDEDTTHANAQLARFRWLVDHAKPKIVYRDGRVDTIPGAPITIEVLADSAEAAIAACQAVVQTCELRVAVKDSILGVRETQLDSASSLAKRWEKIAKGPFFRVGLEATTTLDWKPEAALDLTAGRGRLKLLGRVEVSEGTQTCGFVNNEFYQCDTSSPVVGRFGVRWQP